MNKRDVKRAAIVRYTAEIEGISLTSVRRVMDDRQNNEEVYMTYVYVEDEIQQAIDNVKLLRAVERLSLFDNTKRSADLDDILSEPLDFSNSPKNYLDVIKAADEYIKSQNLELNS